MWRFRGVNSYDLYVFLSFSFKLQHRPNQIPQIPSGTYPFDVLRRRMMLQGMGGQERIYYSLLDAIKKINTYEGIAGYFRGMIPNYIKVLASPLPKNPHYYNSLSLSLSRTLSLSRHLIGYLYLSLSLWTMHIPIRHNGSRLQPVTLVYAFVEVDPICFLLLSCLCFDELYIFLNLAPDSPYTHTLTYIHTYIHTYMCNKYTTRLTYKLCSSFVLIFQQCSRI